MDFDAIPSERVPALLQAMPKAELHMHIEGSLEPELIFRLAQRNGVALAYPTVEALRAAYAFTDLQKLLDIYYSGASVLIREDDFFDMGMAYFRAPPPIASWMPSSSRPADAHGPRSPVTSSTGWPAPARRRSTRTASTRADPVLPAAPARGGRVRDARAGAAVSRQVHRRGARQRRARESAGIRARVRALPRTGLHLVAHAGEEGPPAYIATALDVLRVERVDHGVRCVEDPALVQRLARARVPLTVCPLSNVKLGVYPDLAHHPLKALLDHGLCATVSSDDPAYFGGYVTRNFTETFAALPLTARDAYTLARNSFTASFAAPAQKQAWIDRLDEVFAAG